MTHSSAFPVNTQSQVTPVDNREISISRIKFLPAGDPLWRILAIIDDLSAPQPRLKHCVLAAVADCNHAARDCVKVAYAVILELFG